MRGSRFRTQKGTIKDMRQDLSLRLEQFKKQYVADEAVRSRIAEPPVKFIGDEIMELAVAALLQGENVLLSGGKATGKNILADNLARSTLCRSM